MGDTQISYAQAAIEHWSLNMPHLRDARRQGVTVVEVLVVVGICSIVIALLLPAIAFARESMRRAQCASNLRQIGLATIAYEHTWRTMPPGRVPMTDVRFGGSQHGCGNTYHDKSYLVRILPNLEQGAIFDKLSPAHSIYSQENAVIFSHVVSGLDCPSDAGAELRPIATGQFLPMHGEFPDRPPHVMRTSYRGCFGYFPLVSVRGAFEDCQIPEPVKMQLNGMMNDLPSIPMTAVRDGLSHTVLLSETASYPLQELQLAFANVYDMDAVWFGGDNTDTLFSSSYPVNSYRKLPLGASVARRAGASSMHPKGVNVFLCDGSVKFISDSIDSWSVELMTGEPVGSSPHHLGHRLNLPPAGVWQALCTRDGRERNLTQLEF